LTHPWGPAKDILQDFPLHYSVSKKAGRLGNGFPCFDRIIPVQDARKDWRPAGISEKNHNLHLKNKTEIPRKARSETSLPSLIFKVAFLVARGQGCGLKAGSAGGKDPMKDCFPSA